MKRGDLYGSADLAQFYDLDNDWGADFSFCEQLALGANSLLDLGCGTGLFAASMGSSGRRSVVGVDPARAMLDIARARPGGEHVRWIEADARDVALDMSFDLVVLTGHAFQVFLMDDDRSAVLRTIARHLSPGGRFIFDSRNPNVEAWKRWNPAESQWRIEHPRLGPVSAWNDVAIDPQTGVVTYETFYEVTADGSMYSSSSQIAFPSKERIEKLIDDAGLVAERWMGDWRGGPYCLSAPEIIPMGRIR